MSAIRVVRTRRSAAFVGGLLLAAAFVAPAFAEIETVVVTAEKRSADVQTVPIAISVFGSKDRDLIGVQSIQDMTNFTPGLEYSTATDRISLRGVGRLTNVLSADASVANYDDGLYETFAVAAGRSSLDLDRVEVLRGPQGTLYGRNAIGGALNEITRRPTEEFEGEIRATYGNYDHEIVEVNLSGPIGDGWLYRVYGNWDKQGIGYAKNIIPGMRSEYQHYDDWYADGQLQTSFFGGALDFWTKFQSAQWMGGAGNAGAQSSLWNKFDAPTYMFGVASTELNPHYGCSAAGAPYDAAAAGGITTAYAPTTAGGLSLAQACLNPEVNSPWKINRVIPYNVHLPEYYSLNTHLTWHTPWNFDVADVLGGTFYRYILTGGTENAGATSAARGAITGYKVANAFFPHSAADFQLSGDSSFNYQEHNGFISNELTFLSTGSGPLQWTAGLYIFQQHYSQPVTAGNPGQPQYEGFLGDPVSDASTFCPQTAGICAPVAGSLWFNNQPRMHATSEAAYAQAEYAWNDELKFTGGIRYSADRKYGTESVRLLCFGVPNCYTAPEFNSFVPGGIPAVDLTQLGSVVASGVPGPLPRGVLGLTTYNPVTGLASRNYHASWGALTGTVKVDWTPDDSTLVYGSYSKGYKSGGFNIGIFTVLSFAPYTQRESVNSFEIGAKKTFGDWLQVNTALFHYGYKNLQIPLTTLQSAGGLTQAETNFFNVPGSISQGFELETLMTPLENLQILFNYSYLDAHITSGMAADPADPNATAPGAKPAYTDLQCQTAFGVAHILGPFDPANIQPAVIGAVTPCSPDIYTTNPIGVLGTASALNGLPFGWTKPQFLKGNILPNSPKNKIAINLQYTIHTDTAGTFTPSVSYVWRGSQYGTLFTRSYNRAPPWDQVDARLVYNSPDGDWEAILFGKNIFNTIGYDAGALGTRLAGCNSVGGSAVCFVQGVNNPAGYGAVRGENATGQVSSYSPTPPATYGIEVHYKF